MPAKLDDYILGIDYGSTNLGLALGRNGLVIPLRVINAKNTREALDTIFRTVIENKVSLIVVGLPLTAEGKETKKSLEIRKVAKLIKTVTKRPLEFQNEYASTIDTEEEMINFDVSQKKRRIKDHYAAALILKHFYSEHLIKTKKPPK